MNEQVQSARENLAFMRGIAEDKEPLPWGFGAQLLAAGSLYAPGTILIWAVLTGLIQLPQQWLIWSWVPAALIHAPVCYWLTRITQSSQWGPNQRVFGAAWSAMGLMSMFALLALSLAAARLNAPVLEYWPAAALIFYGGAWSVLGFTQPRSFYLTIAFGSFATAILCAYVIGQPVQWLILGLGLLAWLAAPGLLIMRRGRAR